LAKFGVSWGDFTTAASVITMIKLVSVTKAPVEIVEAAMYGGGTTAPADIAHTATLARVSAVGAGTGTASPPTPEPFGNTLVAASSTILWKMTAEPTTYATVFPVLSAFNQRGGMRWAVPRGEGVSNQFENTQMHTGWRNQSSAAGTCTGHLHWWE
jgi:hypothetical protein